MAASKIHQRQGCASMKEANVASGRLLGNRIDNKIGMALNGDSDGVGSKGLLVADYQNRYKSVRARPGVPILFLVVCFIIIASSSCDPVGSATLGKETTSKGETKPETDNLATRANQRAATTKSTTSAKYDPLSMLREIYLDHDSKVITMILPPPGGEPASAYHPNLRYGRRSVVNVAEPASAHTEFGKLTFNNLGSLKSLLQLRPEGSSKENNINRLGANLYQYANEQPQGNADGGSTSDDSSLANFQSEIGKLLKCNYLGVSNLYWCDTGTSK